MEGTTIEGFYFGIPFLSRVLTTVFFCVTLLSGLNLFNPEVLLLSWPLVVSRLHIWRPITNYLFIGKFGFPFVFNLYFFITFSGRLERNECFTSQGTPGSYLFFLLINMLTIDGLSCALAWPNGLPMNFSSLLMAIIYYWSRREAWAQLTYWGFSIQGYQLPWALMFFNMLLGGSPWGDLLGVAAGHTYYFLKEVLPAENGMTLLKTPGFIDQFMIAVQEGGRPAAAGGQAGRAAPPPPPRQFGGRGYRLGGD